MVVIYTTMPEGSGRGGSVSVPREYEGGALPGDYKNGPNWNTPEGCSAGGVVHNSNPD